VTKTVVIEEDQPISVTDRLRGPKRFQRIIGPHTRTAHSPPVKTVIMRWNMWDVLFREYVTMRLGIICPVCTMSCCDGAYCCATCPQELPSHHMTRPSGTVYQAGGVSPGVAADNTGGKYEACGGWGIGEP
jgi:hypothetical protein